MTKIVYIAHCVDAEGPLYESIGATFERIYETFGINIEASYENLKKLQNKKISLSGQEEAVANLVSARRLNYNDTWTKIDNMLDEITSNEFRQALPDSFGNGWIYNWFCIDHVGFTGENPRRRTMGYHAIFDHYNLYNKLNNIKQDRIQWHFHPLSVRKDAHRAGTAYVSSPLVFEILARKIIDRKWFPAAYRPGFHTERPDSNWLLEQWIPFDYANQAVKGVPTDQPDLANGRFGDWRKAPTEWKVYHPDHDNYQKEGNCRRWIARCLNMEARLREITIDDFRDGFERAALGKTTLISFTNHDFRDMKPEIDKMRSMLEQVSKKYPDVEFRYCNAIEAMREVIGIDKIFKPDFEVQIDIRGQKRALLEIESKNKIFGPQPFLAIKTKSNQYFWDNLDFQGANKWSYAFDIETLSTDAVDKVGVAANTESGVTEVVVLNISENKMERNILNL